MTHSFLLFVIYALCVFRLTHLLVDDKISERPREWLRKKHGELVTRDNLTGNIISKVPAPKPHSIWSWLWSISTCSWCASVWIGAVVVIVAYYQSSWFVYVCAAFALSGVAGIISERL
jgi:hypothetical protein